ncbi:hypothetical protein AGOR_G00239730 [Albula goreensis]|uniref:Uncharacterized protein n=1 Tax=Albula goreensis TaxID=1534307 RepID=A0A8T3CG39_9TELE|nr:hypothetical protein AGOR_G00239730 [Albula goreensis]
MGRGPSGEDCPQHTLTTQEKGSPEQINCMSYSLTVTEDAKGRPHPISAKSLQKPLLQVSYGSSYSLPAGFKAMEPQSADHHRGRSIQSDSALLPSNVYFQRPQRSSHSTMRASHTSMSRGSQEEEISRTLDRAIEAARKMKHRTDKMAESLSADLARAELQRKLHGLYTWRRRENTDS